MSTVYFLFLKSTGMKKLYYLYLLFFASIHLSAQDARIVGYLPHYRFAHLEDIDFEGMTHLCIAFGNPDMAGNISVGNQDISEVVATAKSYNNKVLLSLAGGYLTAEWQMAWEHHMLAENKTNFIHQIMDYVRLYELDGIDFDLEWGHVNEKYSPFVLELRDSLSASSKLLTAALPATYRYPDITDEALYSFDFINMMAYDLTGPWAPNNPGAHSPYSFAQSAIDYWIGQGVLAENLTLGLPFYGYDFTDQTNVQSFSFRQMIEEDIAYAELDQVGQRYYNGRPTIAAKTVLGLEQVSGVMIWELGQDAFDEYSLLEVVYDVIYASVHTHTIERGIKIKVFPNPVSDIFQIRNEESEVLNFRIINSQGQVLLNQQISGKSAQVLQISHWAKGFYTIICNDGNQISSYRFLKVD